MSESSDPRRVCRLWNNAECIGTEHCPPRCPRFFDGTGTPILITPFEEDGLADLVTMYEGLDGTSRASGLPPRGRESIERWLRTLTDDGWNLVARHDDRVVGHVGVPSTDDEEAEFIVFVTDDYQGRGIGTELVKQVVAYAADRGHDGLTLHVERGNQRAITVYRNVAFEVQDEEITSLGMHLSLEKPIAEEVRRPPAER